MKKTTEFTTAGFGQISSSAETIKFSEDGPYTFTTKAPTVEMTPVSIDWPIAMWMGPTPKVGDRYVLEVYEVADSTISGNVAVKLRPVKR